MKRNYQMPNEDPEQMKFELPSEKEHLLNVIEVKENTETNPDIIRVKLEVVGGDEAGRTLLHRLDLDENSKAFWVTRLFLKAIGEPYKGNVDVDTDRWYAQELIATVIHNGKYANIDTYNFELQEMKPTSSIEQSAMEAAAWDKK